MASDVLYLPICINWTMLESPRGNLLHYDEWSFWCAFELHLSLFWWDFVHQGYWSRFFGYYLEIE